MGACVEFWRNTLVVIIVIRELSQNQSKHTKPYKTEPLDDIFVDTWLRKKIIGQALPWSCVPLMPTVLSWCGRLLGSAGCWVSCWNLHSSSYMIYLFHLHFLAFPLTRPESWRHPGLFCFATATGIQHDAQSFCRQSATHHAGNEQNGCCECKWVPLGAKRKSITANMFCQLHFLSFH